MTFVPRLEFCLLKGVGSIWFEEIQIGFILFPIHELWFQLGSI